MVDLYRLAWRDFKRNAPALIAFSLLFRLLFAVSFAPASAWVVGTLIATTGDLALGNEDLIRYVLSPFGVLTVLVGAAFSLAAVFSEQAGVLNIAEASIERKQVTSLGAVWSIVRIFHRLLSLGLIEAVLYGITAAPFLALAGLTYWMLLTQQDINYYWTVRPTEFWLAVSIGGVLVAGLALIWGILYVRWSFAVAALQWEQKRPLEAMRRSRELIRPLFWQIILVRLGWLAAVFVSGVVAAWVLDQVDDLVLRMAGSRLGVALPAVAFMLTLNFLVASAIAFASITLHCHLVARLYHQALRAKAEPDDLSCDLSEPVVTAPIRRLSFRKAFWSLTMVFAGGTVLSSYTVVENLDLGKDVRITAHRGFSKAAPENTLAAVQAAIDGGADFAEIDVQQTADGVVVVIHDEDLNRIARVNKRIWEITYEDLRKLDAGSWFSPQFAGEPIPRLEDVIAAAKDRIRLNIELKYNGHENRLEERVVEIIREHDFTRQCVITSLSRRGLMRVREIAPNLPVGYILFQTVGDTIGVGVDFFSVNTSLASEEFVQSCQDADKEVHVWTVNDRETALRMIDRGVDNLITDEPARMLQLREELEALSNTERVLLALRHSLMQ